MILVEKKRRRNECDEKGVKKEKREREREQLSKEERKEEEKKTRDSDEFVAYRGTGCWQREQPRSAKLPRYRATPCCAPVK